MKPSTLMLLPFAFLASGISMAQEPPPLIEGVPTIDGSVPKIDGSAPKIEQPGANPEPAIEPVPAAGGPLPSDQPAIPPSQGVPGNAFAPLEQQKLQAQQASDGYIIKDAGLNDIFQFLSKSAGKQYFHNVKINGPEYLVTGHLNDGNPLQQMEELAFMYGLSLHIKGNTIYALTQAQLSQLPAAEFHYQLKYLRPSDMDQIKELVRPVLSPGTGIVNFEPKTNTIIIIDSAHRIEQARSFLHSIDQAKGQIVVETKIFRVNSTSGQRTGVNWRNSLGETGTELKVAQSLNSIFGIPHSAADDVLLGASENLVLSPVQLTGVLRALAEGKVANQVSNPTLITEDNEQASISIIDRIPIITTSVNQSEAVTQITEEVRYKIDTADKTIAEDPEKHREIGISLVVTPTVLSDGTVRMRLRPRSAQVVESIRGQTGNLYPRVSESMVESIARVPDGYSLVVGGFYGEVQSKDKTKIPILGDIPVINFFFKSKDAAKEQSSLVFIVTPKSYDPTNKGANRRASEGVRASTQLSRDHDWIDPYNPGPAHEPNLRRSIRGTQPEEAPYYPRAEELRPKTNKAPRIGRP